MRRSAFSLVELSIVLVILGLLVGGILTGKSLIHASELRSVTQQYQQYITAVKSFQDKYFALPGDMKNATSFWGAQNPSPNTCISTASTDTKTCNGNGDNKITDLGILWPLTYPAATELESTRAWQHLSNAGLIAGQYNGTYSSFPPAKINNGAWQMYDFGIVPTNSHSPNQFDGNYNNSLFISPQTSFSYTLLNAEDIWNIDTKLDDGKPGTGKIIAFGTITTCTNAVDGSTVNATYALTATTVACSIIFSGQF